MSQQRLVIAIDGPAGAGKSTVSRALAERLGIPLSYVTALDVATKPGLLDGALGFVSLGHDEYWSRKQYDHCMEAVKRGVNFGFFSGNSCCFVVPMLESSAKVPNRVIERVGRTTMRGIPVNIGLARPNQET